jgi:hypothetical protein
MVATMKNVIFWGYDTVWFFDRTFQGDKIQLARNVSSNLQVKHAVKNGSFRMGYKSQGGGGGWGRAEGF